MYGIFFIHSSVDGRLGRFHVFAAVNSAAVNTGVHVSFQISFFLFRIYARTVIAESYDDSVFLFFKGFHAILHSGCTSLHPRQWCRRAPFSPLSLKHLLFVDISMPAILTGVT